MAIKDEIIKTVEIIINKKIENLLNRDASGVVTEIKENKYKVNINGSDYWLKDGVNINPNIGTAVWIYIPYGNMINAYICGRK